MKKAKIEALKKAIALPNFQHRFLLKIALTHPDYIYQKTNLSKQEREKLVAEHQGLTNLGSAVFARIITGASQFCRNPKIKRFLLVVSC